MESTNIFSRIKSKILPINSQLLKLKLCYFLLYAVGSAQMPYVSIILTRIVNYQQLSILYICVTVVSTVGQIILGFVADKLGVYKATIILGSCVGCFINLLMIWLESEHKSYTAGFNETIHLAMGEPNQTNYPTYIDGGGWIFPVLLIVRVLGFLGMDAAFTLLDSFGMATTEKYGGDFGKQRMWAMFANIIVPTLCGLVVDAVSYYLGHPNYWSALLFAAGFAVFFILTISKMEIKVQRNKESMLKTTKKMIGMLDVDIFFLVQILVGSCTGFHMMFLSIYVDAELIASKTLFGLASSCSGVSAAIASSVTKPIIDRFGEANTVAFSLVVYSIRFIIYTYLQNPWILIITESFDGLTGLLSYSTGCYFCAAAAPPGMLASLNGILAAAFYGIGRTLGAAVGSFLISSHGIRSTYLYFGILAGSTAILYMIAYHLLLKKMEQARLTCSAQSDQGWAEAAKLNQDYKSNDLATTEF